MTTTKREQRTTAELNEAYARYKALVGQGMTKTDALLKADIGWYQANSAAKRAGETFRTNKKQKRRRRTNGGIPFDKGGMSFNGWRKGTGFIKPEALRTKCQIQWTGNSFDVRLTGLSVEGLARLLKSTGLQHGQF